MTAWKELFAGNVVEQNGVKNDAITITPAQLEAIVSRAVEMSLISRAKQALAQEAPAQAKTQAQDRGEIKLGDFIVTRPNDVASPELKFQVWRYTGVNNKAMNMTRLDCYKLISKFKAQGTQAFAWRKAKAQDAIKRPVGRPRKAQDVKPVEKQTDMTIVELAALLKQQNIRIV